MASYFDLPPQEKAAPASIEQVPEKERRQLGGMSLLSPAVSQLLDDLGSQHSDSSSEEGSLSEEEDLTGIKDSRKQADTHQRSRQDKQKQCPQTPPVPSSLSPRRSSPKSLPNKGPGHVKLSTPRGGGGGSTKQKHPHMARFHSLRSMLFSANLEDKMKSVQQEEHESEEAASEWKSQHEQRQMHRPKTPEKDGQGSDGIGSRIRTRIRRMTSREAPSMESIGEDGAPVEFNDRASTASSDNGYDQNYSSWKSRDADEESIDHSDVEDLVRWVSRRDPPSDGEAREDKDIQQVKKHSLHESLGHSDVDDLVRYVSQRSDTNREKETEAAYGDASTESDSEVAKHSSEKEDADDLVRWISHRDGSKAGPVRRNLERPVLDSDVEQHYDSDVPELGRRFKRHDDTSGDSALTTPVHEVEEYDEPERGRPRSRSESPIIEHKTHLRHNDIDELVRWMSRKDSKQQNPIIPESDVRPVPPQSEAVEKNQQLDIQFDQESFSNSDVADLVHHARKRSGDKTSEVNPLRPNEPESGDLRTLRSTQPDVQVIRRDDDEKKQRLGMSVDDGSLSHSDVQDLIQHAKSKAPQQPKSNSPTSILNGSPRDDLAESIKKTEKEQWDMKKDRTGSLGQDDVDELVKWVSRKT